MAILPQHSVMPYDWKKGQPRAATARRAVSAGRGEPPQDSRRRLDRSAPWSAGLLHSSVTMVVARLVTLTRSRPMTWSTWAASKVRTTTWRPPTAVTENSAKASTRWKMGAAWSQTSPAWMLMSEMTPTAWRLTMPCVSRTPLGVPVVPEV